MRESEERNPENIWNVERILYGYIYHSDEGGFLPNIESYNNSTYKIYMQRYYAAMRAYGRNPEWFFKSNDDCPWVGHNNRICRRLLSRTISDEKMQEFRELVRTHLRRTPKFDFIVQTIDSPDYLKSEMEVFIAFERLMEYRKKLYAVEKIWEGMMECSQSTGTIYEVTRDMTRDYLVPMIKIINRMLILLMGDDYDRVFTADELCQYGYPDISDDELKQMEMDEW